MNEEQIRLIKEQLDSDKDIAYDAKTIQPIYVDEYRPVSHILSLLLCTEHDQMRLRHPSRCFSALESRLG